MVPPLRNLVKYFIFLTIFVVSNIYSLAAYIVWMTLLTPFRLWAPAIYWKIEHEIFYWLETVIISWMTFGGYKVIECGNNIESLHNENCLLLSNHQSTGDVPIVTFAVHSKKSAASTILWVIYKLYKWTNFGIACQHREDFFIDVGKAVRDNEMARFKHHLVNSYLKLNRKWIMIFPEGGFLCRNQETSQRYAKKNNLPDLNHVLLPRIGAVKAVLDTVGEQYDEAAAVNNDVDDSSSGRAGISTDYSSSHPKDKTDQSSASLLEKVNRESDPSRPVKWVIDMTLAYKDKEPLELLGMSIGYDPHKDALVHWRAYRVKDIPRDDEALTSWLYQRYIEKEEMLDAYYKENKIPGPQENSQFPPIHPKYFEIDMLYQIMVHAALFTLFYLQWVWIFKPFIAALAIIWNLIF